MWRFFGALCAALVAVPAGAAATAQAAVLQPHQARYDLSIREIAEEAEIVDVSGLLVLEFTGAACSDYTNDVRIVTALDTRDGDRLVTDVRTRTVETADGQLEFINETFVAGEQVEYVVGMATRDEQGIEVDIIEPEPETLRLGDNLLFPTEHMIEVIGTAGAGRSFVTADIFDGSEDGTLVYQTATVIGHPKSGPLGDEADALMEAAGFDDMTYWPVTVSYFELSDEVADAVPDFVVSFLLYENGLSRRFVIDYDDFALRGRLTSLDVLPLPDCAL